MSYFIEGLPKKNRLTSLGPLQVDSNKEPGQFSFCVLFLKWGRKGRVPGLVGPDCEEQSIKLSDGGTLLKVVQSSGTRPLMRSPQG